MAEVQTGRGFYILRCAMNQHESASLQPSLPICHHFLHCVPQIAQIS